MNLKPSITYRHLSAFLIFLTLPFSVITISGANTTKNKKARHTQEEILAADALYAKTFGDKGDLTMYSTKKFAILTCMDCRLDPAKIAGLKEGDAYVIRNAGGRASDDAIRSLVISSKLLKTKEWFVIHHTDCGMETFTDVTMRNLMKESLEKAIVDKHGHWHNKYKGHGSTEALYIDWLTINSGLNKSVIADVTRIRNHPLVSKQIPIYGYIYDVYTGKLIPVPTAMKIGAVKK